MKINQIISFLLSMKKSALRRMDLCRLSGVLAISVLLSGCGGMQAYREGNALLAEGKTQQGLVKLEEAVRLDPKNAEYRITLSSRRASVINQLMASGEAARRDGKLVDAEKFYLQAQNLDANNVMARQGLDALAMERRHQQALMEADALFRNEGNPDLNAVLEKVRDVLSENPNQKEALSLKARVNESRSRMLKPEMKLAAMYQKPISLEFRDAPLRSVFDFIAQVSGLNFFFDNEVRPDLKATVLAKNTSIEDAIHLLLTTNQLRQKVLNANSILIYPNVPQKVKDYQSLVVRSFFLANADVKAVANTIKTIVKTQDMVVDERLGAIILRDTPDAIRMAERIVAIQDLSDPEVMLEVEVMEIKRSRLLELGVQWPGQLSLTPLQTASAPLTLEALKNLSASTTQATIGSWIINARKEDQDGNVLANPRIRVRNKEKAKVMIGDRVPVITTTSTTISVSESVSYADVGLKLEVEPNVSLDDEVAIKVGLEVSNLVREIVTKNGTLSYQIGTRSANTVLRLKNGETQILAGLISDEDRSTAQKLPGLGEMPVLGQLFGSRKDDVQRSEILLSITPRILRSIRRPDLMSAEFESGTETSIGTRPLSLPPTGPLPGKTNEIAAPGQTTAASPTNAATPQ